ncbi:MAG TPA: hypothetical protein VHU84_07105 [Lacipirellulaceae bacterium]|nr:hypothetical protein [Lacipirellulaceae bacterium]
MRTRFLSLFFLITFGACHPLKTFVGTYSLAPDRKPADRMVEHLPRDGGHSDNPAKQERVDPELLY